MDRLHALAVGMIVALSLAAAPASKPTKAPTGKPVAKAAAGEKLVAAPMTWKAKAGAPAWVVTAMGQYEMQRERSVDAVPKDIERFEAELEKTEKATIDPSLQSERYMSTKLYKFKTAEAKAKSLASTEKHLSGLREKLKAAQEPFVVPDKIVDGVKLRDWVEPIDQAGTAQKK